MSRSGREKGCSCKHGLCRGYDWLARAAMNCCYAHVDGSGSERLRDRGNTLDGRRRNKVSGHSWFVVYRYLDLNVGCTIHMWLPYFSW